MSYNVKDYMSTDVVTIDFGASALSASKLMAEKSRGYVIVVDKGKPAGIVTERDLVMMVMSKEKDPSTVRVSEFMSRPLITIDIDASLEDAVKTMAKHRIRRLPVVKNNYICGIFTTRELTRNFSKYQDRVAKDLVDAQIHYGTGLELGF